MTDEETIGHVVNLMEGDRVLQEQLVGFNKALMSFAQTTRDRDIMILKLLLLPEGPVRKLMVDEVLASLQPLAEEALLAKLIAKNESMLDMMAARLAGLKSLLTQAKPDAGLEE